MTGILPGRELPLIQGDTWHRHASRKPGAHRTRVPSPPFSPATAEFSWLPEEAVGWVRSDGRIRIDGPASVLVGLDVDQLVRLGTSFSITLFLTGELYAGRPADLVRLVQVASEATVPRIHVQQPISDGPELLPWIELCKACLTAGVELDWAGTALDDNSSLVHLLPPSQANSSTWAYRLLGWRRGPGFLHVVDARTSPTVDLTLDGDPLVEVFGTGLDRIVAADSLGDLLDELVELDLVTRVGNQVSWLPYRVRTIPVNRVL